MADADILCLSCLTCTVNRGKAIAKEYKAIRAAAGKPGHSMAGGIHASMIPDDVTGDFDQIISGEAENVFLDCVEGRIADHLVRGTPVADLDTLPIPDYSALIDPRPRATMPVLTSRGCPYNCTFCSVTEMFGHTYRCQSPERVVEELNTHTTDGTKWIFFVDDHFAANTDRTDRLLDLMLSSGFALPWSAQVRTEVTRNEALVAKMRRAGCRNVFVGFESVNPATLENFNKRQTVEDIRRSIDVFHRCGISVHGMFMLGGDEDSVDVFTATSRFSHRMGVDLAQYTILTPLPGTKLFRQFEQEGRLLHRDWSLYDTLHCVYKPRRMTPGELQEGMIGCFNDFYNYFSATIDALEALGRAGAAAFRSRPAKAWFPSLNPLIMRVAGRHIVRQFVRINRRYCNYLREQTAKASDTISNINTG
jgi:radical SAM superfamily enzyme YgiQ (UPF0313 family)